MSQTELASVGGVGKTTQINYEKGLRSPDAAYLAAVADAGVDVAYVILGKPTQRAAQIDEALLTRVVGRLDEVAKQAGKRWPPQQLVRAAVEVYHFLLEEEVVDDDKLDRVLKLVVNR